MYGRESFQTAASLVDLGVSEFGCRSFKSGVLVSYCLPALQKLSPTDFQSQTIWGPLFFHQAGMSGVRLEPLIYQGGSLSLWYPSHLWVAMPGMFALTRPYLCPSYMLWYGLYIQTFIFIYYLFIFINMFRCGRAVLLFVLRKSCSICSCSFGVSVGEGKLRILFCHCDLSKLQWRFKTFVYPTEVELPFLLLDTFSIQSPKVIIRLDPSTISVIMNISTPFSETVQLFIKINRFFQWVCQLLSIDPSLGN